MAQAITLAKLAASSALIAATLGLLWHQTSSMGHWEATDSPLSIPGWLYFGLSGWHSDNLPLAYRLFVKSPLSGTAYVLCNVLCVAAIMVIPFINRHFVRALLGLPILLTLAYELVVFDISGALPNEHMTKTMLANIRFGLDGVVWSYDKELLRNIAFVFGVGILYLYPPPRRLYWKWAPAAKFAIVSGAVASVFLIHIATQRFTRQFASPFSTFIYSYHFLSTRGELSLKDVDYKREITPQFDKIVLVMDESVRGDFISLNNAGVDTTPYLAAMRSKIANFGIASSAANCSIESRLAVRYMLRQSDLGKPWPELLTNSTVWQYARKAGYKTVYIDSFGGALTLTSGMTASERNHIDDRISMVGTPHYSRDRQTSKLLRTLLQQNGQIFIMVDKYGTHIPYTQTYPAEQNVFNADLAKAFDIDDIDEMTRHYKNAIRWSVDGFFRDLGAELPPSTLLIYTSDHGQSLSIGGRMSHCSTSGQLRQSEIQVPLFAISSEESWDLALNNAARLRYNRASHLHIAPTLLSAMGYEANFVSKMFDTPPLNASSEPLARRVWFAGRSIEVD